MVKHIQIQAGKTVKQTCLVLPFLLVGKKTSVDVKDSVVVEVVAGRICLKSGWVSMTCQILCSSHSTFFGWHPADMTRSIVDFNHITFC